MFDPDSVDGMARAIERVVNDDDRRQSLIALGTERLKKFSWAACARETLNVYRGVLS